MTKESMMNDELPEGWAVAHFNDVGKARMGSTILAKDLSETGLAVYSAGQANKPWGYTKRQVPEFKHGTVVVSARGSIGFPKIPSEAIFTSTQTTIAIRPTPVTSSLYLQRFLQTVDWAELSSGAAIPMLTISMLGELAVPIAPLAEQKRIADKLEAVLGRVDACRARLDRVPDLLKRFRQSVLAAATSGQLTDDWRHDNGANDEWVNVQVREIADAIFDGPFGSHLKTDDYTEAGVRVVRMENIGALQFFEEKQTFISPAKYETLKRHTLKEHDVIFSSFISEQIRVSLLPKSWSGESINKSDCFCVRTNHKKCIPKFLAFRLACRSTFAVLGADIHGATRPRINLGQLKDYAFDLPSLAEQAEIVRRVEALFAMADRIEASLSTARAQVERLTPATLAKAFRGDLVPQDPNDEPASKLLERLKPN
jgi:type I restriction enzyme S subunit